MSKPRPLWWSKPPAILSYGIAVLSVAAATGAGLALDTVTQSSPIVSLFLCAIMFVAWFGGTGPGLFATAISIVTFDYYFVTPIHSFVLDVKDIPRIVLFAIAAVFLVSLSAAQRRAAEALRGMRDDLREKVRELEGLNEALQIESAERKQAEQKIRRAERELQLTIDTIPVMAASYRLDGSLDFVNQTWRNYTGLSLDGSEKPRQGVAIHPDDVELVEREWSAHLATGEPFELEQRMRRADGEYRRYLISRVPLRDENGNVIKWYGAGYDVEDQKQAEDALQRSEAYLAEARRELQATIDTIPTLVASYLPDGSRDFVNQAWQTFTGISQDEARGRSWSITVHPDDMAVGDSAWHASLATGQPLHMEQRFRRVDGEYRWHLVDRVPLRNEKGDVIRWYSVSSDIEDRKRVEDALRKSEAYLAEARRELQLMIDMIPALVTVFRPDGEREFVNQTWRDYTGFALKDIQKGGWRTVVHPDDHALSEAVWRHALATGEPLQFEHRIRRADGEYRWHMGRRVPLRDASGNIVRWYGVGTDIQDQKGAEDALRRSEAHLAEAKRELQVTVDTIPALVARYRADGSRDFVNQTWREYTGVSQEEATGESWKVAVHPDDMALAASEWRARVAAGKPFQIEQRLRRADGEYRWHMVRRVPLRDGKGNIVRWYAVGSDIEDQKRAEDALRRSEAYLAEAQRISLTGSFGWKVASGDIVWSDETYRIFGLDRTITPTIDLILQHTHPDDRELVQQELDRAAQGDHDFDVEHRLLMPDGLVKHLHVRSRRVKYESGEEEIVGALIDVTAARKAQEALQATQAELTHITRLTTLGEMSASIAHEVNQPLAAIVTNAGACLRWLDRETPNLEEARRAAERIANAGNRAGEVIRSVRALSSKTEPRKALLDINDVVSEVIMLMQRELLNHRVSLRTELAPALPMIVADRVQLQQVIINLVINGIEAMEPITDRPRELVIRSHLDEAHQVLITVKDSGVGIYAENADRLFNAFVTTKSDGMGMGLSICRSIIEAHGGRVWVEPNLPAGAAFHFNLPLHQEDAP